MRMKPELILFDVNETLLDLSALRPRFEEVFGSAEPMGEWFARMLHGSLVANHTRRFRSFGTIGAEALVVLAKKRGVELGEEQAARVVEGMRSLPPHPDVAAALDRLAAAGYRLATLTNGSVDVVADQVTNAGIAHRFERRISVDEVGRFKPAPEVYLHAAAVLGTEVDRALLVAAHDWDVIGARSVGMPGAFLTRPGVVWGLPDPLPDLVAPDLGALAARLEPGEQGDGPGG